MLLFSSFLSLTFLASFTTTTQADSTASAKASSLGLNSTWTAPFPTSNVSPASDYITTNWFAAKGFYGDSNVEFVQDPFNANSSGSVLQVKYPAGSFAPVATKNGNAGLKGGAEFFSEPDKGKMYNTALLSYDLAFDSSFNWVKGGKLPGIYGGKSFSPNADPILVSKYHFTGVPGVGCSGGEKASGDNCFSVRLMWRDGGT